ncbi:hypothetical protein J8273_3378 [Carpediemonas membranifera]|uniref:ZZ-type domain-containing protein n=1 Tax=Carpediemonas membranifera TaxID=201153 RepID=A0A8J6AV34_9EUKA|nr:hypothetical protein J8273_3378 [Carpediemonas membranifera]|eukprot:KAG9393245.1 hypothetical protein J8273_3378 [Carpediemonas membranifera]
MSGYSSPLLVSPHMSIRRDGFHVQKSTLSVSSPQRSTSNVPRPFVESSKSRWVQTTFNNTAEQVAKDLDERLYCSSCYRFMKHPHVLECGHIICRRCVETLRADLQNEEIHVRGTGRSAADLILATPATVGPMTFSSLTTPGTMRPANQGPYGSTPRLPDTPMSFSEVDSEGGDDHALCCPVCHKISAVAAARTMASLFPDILCAECQDSVRRFRCEQCGGISLCADCDRAIHSHASLSGHIRIPIMPEGRPCVEHPLMCAHHPQAAATMFELLTKTPLCTACAGVPSMKARQVVPIDQAHPKLVKAMEKTMAQVDEWRERASSQLRATGPFEAMNDQHMEDAVNSLLTARDSLHATIDSHFDQIHRHLIALHEERKQYYSTEIEDLREALAASSEAVISAKKQLHHRAMPEVISMQGYLADRIATTAALLEEHSRKFRPSRPTAMPALYTPAGLVQLIENIGLDPSDVIKEPGHHALPAYERERRERAAQDYEAAAIQHSQLLREHEESAQKAYLVEKAQAINDAKARVRKSALQAAAEDEQRTIDRANSMYMRWQERQSKLGLPGASRSVSDVKGCIYCRSCHAQLAHEAPCLQGIPRTRGHIGLDISKIDAGATLTEEGADDNMTVRCTQCHADVGRHAYETGSTGFMRGLVYLNPVAIVEAWAR